MSAVFRAPVGLERPTGGRAPSPLRSPWPLAEPIGSKKPSRRERHAARQVLGRVTLAPGTPLRLWIIGDDSGSMMSVAGPREAAVLELMRWAQRHLGPEDEIGVIAFGGDACVRMEPASVCDKMTLDEPELTSYATMLGPTWQLIAGFPRTDKLTLAVLVSDGLVADLTGPGSRVNAMAAGINGVTLLIPSECSFTGGVPGSWSAAFPDDPARVIDSSAPALATEVVASIAALTGRDARGIGLSGAVPDSQSKERT
ncbi:hypothetical protein [Gordonia aquimaris]|uniref:VWA domain-containing protein n=1 Tax=Gordonia aquimaris TaxID=2984863 RepID=A0A9X3D7Y7_9ACTN|nr:hypothetical protein [Gordonia aquimaris]MCX2966849.1 hypothetical protein [Gordonia aquimaris]